MSVDRVVEIAGDNRHLATERGFMVVRECGEELGRVPLDDIAAVIANAHGLTYSNNLLVRLAERGTPMVLCGANHAPAGLLWAVDGYHTQSARIDAQLSVKRPKAKRLWQQLVQAKISNQAATLQAIGAVHAPVEKLAEQVKSGDSDNMEGQAARRYWPLIFGPNFRRDHAGGGSNAMLNYGYTVLRACVARAIMAAGLHPGIGIHHRNAYNAMRLVDDVMEPYRPYVDFIVYQLVQQEHEDVTPDVKAELAGLGEMAVTMADGVYPLRRAVQKTGTTLAKVYEAGGKNNLALPLANPPLWQAQETGHATFERAQTDVDDGDV